MEAEGQRFALWGFDGDLKGSEARLQGCLPFFQAPPDPRVFAARNANWSFDPPENLTVFASETEAEQLGTRLQLDREILISPGELVLLYGPEFVTNLVKTSLRFAFIFDLPLAPFNFGVLTFPVADYDTLAGTYSDTARKVFDLEIRAGRGSVVSARAEAALSVLRNTVTAPSRDEIIRTLLIQRIKLDPDGFRRSLKLGALRIVAEELEADVSRHLWLLVDQKMDSEESSTLPSWTLTDRFAAQLNQADDEAEKRAGASSEIREPAPPPHQSPDRFLAEAERLHDLEKTARALRKEYLRRAAAAREGSA